MREVDYANAFNAGIDAAQGVIGEKIASLTPADHELVRCLGEISAAISALIKPVAP